TCVSTAINIDFDHDAGPRDFVTYLSQSSPGRTRPEGCELSGAWLDLAFFAMAFPADLKCERCSFTCFSQANLSASRLSCQITLLDNEVPPALEIIRQPFD